MKTIIVTLASLVALSSSSTVDARWTQRTVAANFPNGGFESGHVAPWAAVGQGSGSAPDPSHLTIVSLGYDSPHAARLGAARDGTGWMSATVAALPNTEYNISLEYQVVEVSGTNCTLQLVGSDGMDTDNDQKTSVSMAVGPWQALTLGYANFVGSQFELNIGISCADRGHSAVLIDDITMAAVGSLEPGTCSGSSATVANGGFESGSIAPWQVSHGTDSSFAVVSPGDDSAYALQVNAPANAILGFEWWTDVAGVCFNYDYAYSFAVSWQDYGLVQPNPHEGCVLSVSAYDCATDPFDVYVTPTPPGWTQYSFNCTAQRNSVRLAFGLICGDKPPANAWNLLMDNVALDLQGGPAPLPTPTATPTPTPTPMPAVRAGNKRREHYQPGWI